ncbi:hypothetical protein GCM10010195_44880 [Kitasatospora griseola]|nr:hypothetical protein GCM10010195_44880 [Kitasatospora griseola]
MFGQTSRAESTFPGLGRRWVTNTGPRVRPLSSRGGSRAVPASQNTVSSTAPARVAPRRRTSHTRRRGLHSRPATVDPCGALCPLAAGMISSTMSDSARGLAS